MVKNQPAEKNNSGNKRANTPCPFRHRLRSKKLKKIVVHYTWQ